MPSLLVFPTGTRAPRVLPVVRKITTIGAEASNDIVLDDPHVLGHHAHLLFDGKHFELEALAKGAEITVNGKRRRSARLEDGTVFLCGHTTLQFRVYDVETHEEERAKSDDAEVFQHLLDLSQKLMSQPSLNEVLNALLDQVVQLTSADRGFIILVRDGRPEVRVARGIERRDLAPEEWTYSDSIIGRVLDEGDPVIVKDALQDTDFSQSASVVNLRLCSVMCVPLRARGETLGLIYVGNDNVVNLFDEHALEILTVHAAQAALIVRNALLMNELQDDNVRLRQTIDEMRFGQIIGACPGIREVFRKIEKIATTDISVLIQGETGTGKELVAKEVHARSNRAGGPFVVINCGAIPENLLESELFGHVRGAFTGAVATVQGKFQTAHGGTLFLDEVGELPLALQVKLLRAIQEKKVTKVGDTRAEQVDIRILAATNKVLADEVREGRFREDLFYRLNVIMLPLPALRERADDVLLIARYLLNRYVRELNAPQIRDFTEDAVAAIRRHKWPGNIRELENRIKKAIVFATGPLVSAEDMDLTEANLPPILPLAEARERFQRDYINTVLALNAGNRTQTARDLDVDPRTIFRHLEKDRDDEEG